MPGRSRRSSGSTGRRGPGENPGSAGSRQEQPPAECHAPGLAASATLVSAQEAERRWLSYEFHDRIAQRLVAAFHELQSVRGSSSARPAAGRVTRASRLARQAIRELRSIMDELYSPQLDDSGGLDLLAEELDALRSDRALAVSFTNESGPALPDHVAVTIYRVFHEAVVNVTRHAPAAGALDVAVTQDGSAVKLAVRDDGPGFGVDQALRGRRAGGLAGIEWRARAAGGSLEVESSPWSGTAITLSVPWLESAGAGGGTR